jgi:hypothetical protein
MDVHPPKNGINRYWSIPIYNYEYVHYAIYLKKTKQLSLFWSCLPRKLKVNHPKEHVSRYTHIQLYTYTYIRAYAHTYMTLHCIALHSTTLLILLYITCTTLIKLNHITLPDFTFHYIICITCITYIPCTTCITCTTRFTLLHILHYIALHRIALHYNSLQLQLYTYYALHYIALHSVTAHYTTSHHITSHHIFTSHYTTLTFTFPFCSCIGHATCLARLCPWLLHLTSLWKGTYGGREGGGGSHLKRN